MSESFRVSKFLLLFSITFLIGQHWELHAQGDDELISEVDALNDFPEDDLGAGDGSPLGLDDLPIDEAPADQGAIFGNQNALQGAEAPTGPASVSVEGMDFRQLGDRVRLVLQTDKPADFTAENRRFRKQSIVEILNAKINRSFVKRALDTGQFDGPVAIVKAFDSRIGPDPSVKVLFQLREYIEPTISKQGRRIFIDFPLLVSDGVLYKTQAESGPKPELFLSMSDVSGFKGARMNLRLKDAPMADVLSLISQASGQNFILAEGGDRKVTLSVRNTPWDQVLAILLVNNGLGYQKLGNTYRIARSVTLQQELDDSAKAREKEKELLPLETRLFALSYVTVDDAQRSVEALLTNAKNSSVTTDQRTNSIVVTSIAENLERIERYLRAIDRQTPLVAIEGRIVEASERFFRQFGGQWRLNGISFGTISTAIESIGTSGEALSGAPTINDVTVGTSLEAFLDANQQNFNTRTIAAPKVIASNKQEAHLFQGKEAVFESAEIDNEGNSQRTSNTIEFTLDLKVTPQVTNDGHVMLDIDLKRDTLGDQIDGAEVARDRRGIKTKMLVKSGDTTVIGGLYTDDYRDSESGVPWLKDLPIVGWAFKGSFLKEKDRRELLMFISPRIMNSNSSLLRASAAQVSGESL